MPWSVLNIDMIAQAFPISVCWRTKIPELIKFSQTSLLHAEFSWDVARSVGGNNVWHINKENIFYGEIRVFIYATSQTVFLQWSVLSIGNPLSSWLQSLRMLGILIQIETSYTLILQNRPACCNQSVLPVSLLHVQRPSSESSYSNSPGQLLPTNAPNPVKYFPLNSECQKSERVTYADLVGGCVGSACGWLLSTPADVGSTERIPEGPK